MWALPGKRGLCIMLAVVLLFSGIFFSGHRLFIDRQRAIATLAQRLGPRIIVIDPGHGGIDGGAKGNAGVVEEDVVLAIGKYLSGYLEPVGAKVFLTRVGNEDLAETKVADLDVRWQLADEVGADLLLSIHANSFPSAYEYGAQTFYTANHPDSSKAAEAIQKALVDGIDVLGYNYREIQEADYYILRKASCPAVLVEVGFLSNPREELLLGQAAYQKRVAWCIFVGIVRYFTAED